MLVEELPVISSFTSFTRASGGDDVDDPPVRSGSAVLVVTSATLLGHVRISCAAISGKSLLMSTGDALLVGIGGCASYGLFLCSSC